MNLSILIISYNTRELTLACLESGFAQTRTPLEILVIDNNSDDGSADAIAERFPQARLIHEGENLGFAQANNLGAREAAGEWLLLLNPDTVVLDGAIDKLVAFAATRPEASIFGGRTLFADGSLNPGSCWRRPTPWSAFCIGCGLTALFPKSAFFSAESYGSWKRDSIRQVDIVSGCFLLIRKRVWDELGGFDPGFFMYGEEADMCLRAKKMGHTCLICPDATITHYGGASEKVRADKMVRLFRAKALLFDRHWGARSRWFGICCLDLWAFTRMTAFSILKFLWKRHAKSHQAWCEIWHRRAEWHLGRVGHPPMPTAEDRAPRSNDERGQLLKPDMGVDLSHRRVTGPLEERADFVSKGV